MIQLIKSAVSAAIVCGFLGGAAVLMAKAGVWQPPTPADLFGSAVDTVNETEETAEVEAVVTVVPIHLDCRARTVATVTVHGQREHKALGQTYRTDTVDLIGVGDIDTCVEGGAEIEVGPTGSTHVQIPAASIRFVRPRVDTTRTEVTVTKGLVSRFTDQYTGSADTGLAPDAYAMAQGVIGSSECIGAALDETLRLLTEAYVAEAADRGVAPEFVTVEIAGAIDMTPFDPADYGLDVWSVEETECRTVGADGSEVAAR